MYSMDNLIISFTDEFRVLLLYYIKRRKRNYVTRIPSVTASEARRAQTVNRRGGGLVRL